MIRVSAAQGAKLTSQRPSKYRNRLTEYNGVTYHSAAEARFAAELDLAVRAGVVKSWRRQVPYILHAGSPPVALGRYLADFVVSYTDGTTKVFDIKGFFTALSKWKIRHCEIEYGITVEIVKR